jgi:FAD/FMN-containing dehydrogenase
MALKDELTSIVGAENYLDDPETLERYSKDHSFVRPVRPRGVVYPANKEEVQGIVQYANKNSEAVTPRSSSVSFYGAGIPSQGGIIMDLSRMNKIIELDAKNRLVKVEPGVTWAQVMEELPKEGMMVCNPLLPHADKSVVTSTMEREPILMPKSEFNEVFLNAELILGNGELFYTGSRMAWGHTGQGNPELFIPSNRLWMGSQGTLGIVTQATLKAEWAPVMSKMFFVACDKIEDVVQPLYKIERPNLGCECFVLNNFNLAAIIADDNDEFNDLRDTLPPWTIIFCSGAGDRYPEEKIAYEEEALKRIGDEYNFWVENTVSSVPVLGKKILKVLRKPWPKDVYWKLGYKGACHEIFFYTTLDRAPEFTKAIHGVAAKYGYPTRDIGMYIQPVERARIAFLQYGIPCDPNDAREVERVRQIYMEASELVISMSGLISTPYGPWADMVYKRAATYSKMLKIAKSTYDPNNILNPGKLCF